jgi:hypothetical protein
VGELVGQFLAFGFIHAGDEHGRAFGDHLPHDLDQRFDWFPLAVDDLGESTATLSVRIQRHVTEIGRALLSDGGDELINGHLPGEKLFG